METNKIAVNDRGLGRNQAFDELEKFAGYQELDHKETLRLRLLAEEMLGMLGGIVGDYGAYFWIEGEKKNVALHLDAYVEMDLDKKEELLSVSSSGRNMAAKGLMGRIRDLMENCLLNYDDISQYAADSGMNLMPGDDYSMMNAGMDWTSYSWSLDRYRLDVEAHHMEDTAAEEAWDELEKSIVAKLADDVQVGIRSGKVELVIRKRF